MACYHNPAIQREIQRRAREGLVIFSCHARQRTVDRDIDDLEILQCLRRGILDGEDWNPAFQETTYRMLWKQGPRSSLCVVVALSASHDIVITTFRSVPA